MCQAVALAVVPAGLETFLWVNAGVGIALIAAHELVMGSSAGAIRAGAAHAWEEIAPKLQVRAWLRAARRPLLEAGLAQGKELFNGQVRHTVTSSPSQRRSRAWARAS